MVKKDGVGLARIRSPQEDHVRLVHLGVGTGPASGPKNRRQTDDAGGVSSAVAAVDVVASDHAADELLRNVVQLIRCLGAAEHAEQPRIAFFGDGPERLRDAVQRFVPRRRTVMTTFSDERLTEPTHSIHAYSIRQRAAFDCVYFYPFVAPG